MQERTGKTLRAWFPAWFSASLVALPVLLGQAALAQGTDPRGGDDVAAILPADTLAYGRLSRTKGVIEAVLKAPAWRAPDELRKLVGNLEKMMFEALGEEGMKREEIEPILGSVARVHVALRGFNVETETPELLGVIELSDPGPATRFIEAQAAALGEKLKGSDNPLEIADFRGTKTYKLSIDRKMSLNLAVAGSWLLIALDPLTLKDALQARAEGPLVALSAVPAYRQLAERYAGHDLFVFGNWPAAFSLMRKAMSKSDQEALDAADTVLGLREIKAAGLGSRIEGSIETGAGGEVPTELTIVVPETNPCVKILRGATLDPAVALKPIPAGSVWTMAGAFADPAAKWEEIKKFATEAERAIAKDDDFPKELEKMKKRYGLDLDAVMKLLAGHVSMHFSMNESGREVVGVAAPHKDEGAARRILELMRSGTHFKDAATREATVREETIGNFQVLATETTYGSSEAFGVGPQYGLFGTIDGVAASIAALQDPTKHAAGLASAISSLGGGTATKAFVLDPVAAGRTEDEFEPLGDIVKAGQQFVLTAHEEKDAVRLRANVSIHTFAAAVGLTFARYQEQVEAGRECRERLEALCTALEDYRTKTSRYPKLIEELAAAGTYTSGFDCPVQGGAYEYFTPGTDMDRSSVVLICSKPAHGHFIVWRGSPWASRVSETRLHRYRAEAAAAAAKGR